LFFVPGFINRFQLPIRHFPKKLLLQEKFSGIIDPGGHGLQ